MPTSANFNIIQNAFDKAARALRRDFSELENLQGNPDAAMRFFHRAQTYAGKVLIETLQTARPYSVIMHGEWVQQGADPTRQWCIEPIDGGVNFANGLPYWSSSIALQHKGKIVITASYAPVLNELFFAEHRQGAWLQTARGNMRLRVSNQTNVHNAVIATDMPNGELPAQHRCFGARGLDVCYLAAGRLDGVAQHYAVRDDWLAAAASMLIQEAGGRSVRYRTDTDMDTEHLGFIAANDAVFDAVVSLIAPVPIKHNKTIEPRCVLPLDNSAG